MRRNICYYYQNNCHEVYYAYCSAIQTQFHKTPTVNPDRSITFGLDFSFKYNMNGGACHVRVLPYQNGTAVQLSYSIVQAAGARWKAHCKVLTGWVESTLHTNALPIDLPPEAFMNGMLYGISMPSVLPSATAVAPQPQNYKYCPGCGQMVQEQDRFCKHCGKLQSTSTCG